MIAADLATLGQRQHRSSNVYFGQLAIRSTSGGSSLWVMSTSNAVPQPGQKNSSRKNFPLSIRNDPALLGGDFRRTACSFQSWSDEQRFSPHHVHWTEAPCPTPETCKYSLIRDGVLAITARCRTLHFGCL